MSELVVEERTYAKGKRFEFNISVEDSLLKFGVAT
jgi:hypothetical protein